MGHLLLLLAGQGEILLRHKHTRKISQPARTDPGRQQRKNSRYDSKDSGKLQDTVQKTHALCSSG